MKFTLHTGLVLIDLGGPMGAVVWAWEGAIFAILVPGGTEFAQSAGRCLREQLDQNLVRVGWGPKNPMAWEWSVWGCGHMKN